MEAQEIRKAKGIQEGDNYVLLQCNEECKENQNKKKLLQQQLILEEQQQRLREKEKEKQREDEDNLSPSMGERQVRT